MLTEAEVLVGREEELAALERFVRAVPDGPAAVVIEGDAGIGKTSLIGWAVDEARRRAYSILTTQPTSAESSLSFVALTDLLSRSRELFDDLPPPQRRALEAALLLDDSPDGSSDPRAIGMGLLGVLGARATSGPVLVAVDDVQWLDSPSAAALSFAVRRLTNEPVGVLLALRTGASLAAVDVERSLATERVPLGPLSVGAIHRLLTERLRLSIPRALLLRVHEISRGNPLFAFEIGRALQKRGLPEPGRRFDIPADAETLFAAQLDELPPATLDALAVAAASATPTSSLVNAASAQDVERPLEPAVRADIIRFDGERIHFTHPLITSTVYNRLDPAARRDLHRRLAAAVTDREERARHLALSSADPNEEVAAALDEAAQQAARRGAPTAAAELAELAIELTPRENAGALRTRRRIAAQQHVDGGDAARARSILSALIDELPPGPERAQALLENAYAHTGDQNAMLELRRRAAVEAVGDDRVLAAALRELALTLFVTGEPIPAVARAYDALGAAERADDVRLLVSTLSYVAWHEIWNGKVTPDLIERALALEEQAGYLKIYESPLTVDGLRRMWLDDDLDGARERLSGAEGVARDHGDDDSRAILLSHLALLEYRAGRWDLATAYATEACDLREQFGYSPGSALYYLALIEASRGRSEAAKAAAERGLALCEKTGYEIFIVRNRAVLGFVALSVGDAATGAEILAPLPERLAGSGYGRVNRLEVLPDSVEALISAGRLGEAAGQLEELDEIAATLGSASARARASRCHGLVAAANGDRVGAADAFRRALAAHDDVPDPFERARTLLALGQTQRHGGVRRAARETLQQALAIFDELGAAPWAERARSELASIGGRTSADRGLTGAEQRVAALVAEGRTNREVAAALFVTVRTVETHLSSIYRKLDVRSRTELTRLLGGANGRAIS